jgi:hypothetical protein
VDVKLRGEVAVSGKSGEGSRGSNIVLVKAFDIVISTRTTSSRTCLVHLIAYLIKVG